MAKELESFYKLNADYLKQYKVDDELLIKSNEEATVLIKKAEIELKKLKEVIFDEKIFVFLKSHYKINTSILGEAFLFKGKIDSVILSDKNQASDLMHLCGFPVNQKLSLIYRASQDGFEACSFHEKCNYKPNTLVIIKSANGNIFGGYTEQSWNYINNCNVDPNAFIFSLINKDNKPIKMKCIKPSQAIYCSTDYGPNFGLNDIEISNESNIGTNSVSNLGDSYKHPDYEYESNEAQSFLAGSCKLQVSEIEVFTILKEN